MGWGRLRLCIQHYGTFFFFMATHRGLSCSKCQDLLRQRKGKGMDEGAPPLNLEHAGWLKVSGKRELERGVSKFK